VVKLKLLLITASSYEIKHIRKARVIRFQQVTMPYLAALTPPHWSVEHIDEECSKVNFDIDVDLVGITFHTPSANHAYRISAKFREKGIPVVLGGPHVTLVPDEAINHADTIIVGEAEDIWSQFLDDFEKCINKRRYEQAYPSCLDNIPFSRKDLFHRKDHSGGIMVATRGCPNKCEFCALAVMYKNVFRKRPVEEVAKEYASFDGKVIIFWDDNLTADTRYAKELFKAITPYKKWWSSQVSINAGEDDELLRFAAKSGCKQLFIGLESISQISLDNINKSFNKVEDYYKIIRKIQSYGISVQVGIVFGFDHDNKNIFKDTIDFLETAGVQNATFNILTPYPGTPLFDRLQSEGRILTYDWSKYNGRTDVVFTPKNMSTTELLEGFKFVNRRFYSLGSIAKRLSKTTSGLWWTLPLNLAYYSSYKMHNSVQK
jgi:radical SAM superfamily enzyme YgiQ (UPF0313 family)